MAAGKAFLGSGWAFPIQVEPAGEMAQVANEADIQQSIRIILGTNPGERVMRPDFGAGLNAFVFEPANPATMSRLQNRVEGALVQWEPRIDVLGVTVTRDPANLGRLVIDIDYRVRATNTVTNLVYPFYLEEGTPA
ncbi:MAG: GPW/gp25 family protein [Anaerolineae bacterium]|nr:GPW/gp25 family protein [Anaerolineae bacterium]